MKTRSLLFVLISFFVSTGMNQVMAVEHGSMCVQGAALYPQYYAPATPDPAGAAFDVTMDFKIVTVNGKTFAWTNLSKYGIGGDVWASQIRWWQPGKVENNLAGRVAGTAQTYGVANAEPTQNPVTITFFQAVTNDIGWAESDDFQYDATLKNSAVAGDNAAPVLANPQTVDQTATTISLHLSATDANPFFYLITDAANNFSTVSFIDDITIAIEAGKAYNFSIKAIDFSGNESAAKSAVIGAQEITNIVEGTAGPVKFHLDSRSLTELVIYVNNPDVLFGDAFVKITLNGKTVEIKPNPAIVQTAGSHNYRITVPAAQIDGWAENAVVALNLGYVLFPIDWASYVMDNSAITAGANNGKPILHKIGTGVDIVFPQAIAKVEITPAVAITSAGTTVPFSAVAKTELNDEVTATFSYSVDSGSASINAATGEFTSATPGSYVVTATEQGTQISATANITVEALSLLSSYCGTSFGAGVEAALISFTTNEAGDVEITIAPANPELETAEAFTAFRGQGWNDARLQNITVNGIPNKDFRFFTRTTEGFGATLTKVIFTPQAGAMNVGDIIQINDVLEYRTPGNENAWPTIAFKYTYGATCGTVAIQNVDTANALSTPARYYNLQGMEVAKPATKGIYIKKEGNQTTKFILK